MSIIKYRKYLNVCLFIKKNSFDSQQPLFNLFYIVHLKSHNKKYINTTTLVDHRALLLKT